MSQLDHAFGKLMKALDEQKLADTTFVFFTSDNGPEGDGLKNRTRGRTGGLRGRKRAMYEGGIRVPGIARWPGHIKPGITADGPVIGSDLFPTVLGACEVKPPADRVIDGTDVFPLLTGKVASADRKVPLYWRLNMAPNNLQMAMRDGDWKIVAAQDFSKVELYELKTDPKEASDLSGKETERLAAMTKRLKELNAEIEKKGPDWWKRLSPNGGGPVKKK